MKKFFILLLVLCLLSGCAPTTDGLTENTPDLSNPTPEVTNNSLSIETPNVTDNVTFTATVAPTEIPTPKLTVTEPPFDKNNYKMLYVIGSEVNVRSKPSTSGELLFQMKLNQQVKAFYEKDGWYYIEYSENNYGYMFGKYLSEAPSPTATPTPTMSRDEALNYNYRLIPTHLINEDATTTYEIMESENGKILVYEAKISQITQKIKDKDANIGAMVDTLIAKWISFIPNTQRTYMSLVEEFEPGQGTLFQVTRISVEANEYKKLLDYLENVYLMMIGYEAYKNLDTEKTMGSTEEYEHEFNSIYGNIERLGSEVITEALQNANGYAAQSQKIADWYSLWNNELGEFFDLKWQILEKLDFSKNTKPFENYKACDKYVIYNSYNNQFREIILIMRGETTYEKG